MLSLNDFYQNLYQPLHPNSFYANYAQEQAAAAAAILSSQYQFQQVQQFQQLQQEQLQQLYPFFTQQLHSPAPMLQPVLQPIQPSISSQLREYQLQSEQLQPQQHLQPQYLNQQEPTCNRRAVYSSSSSSSQADLGPNVDGTRIAKRSRPKKFQCPFCWVALSNTGQYKGHIRIHTGERPYICDFLECGKSFTRNEELTRHKRIHTGLRPYACDICNKSFGRKDHLKKHTRTHEKHLNSSANRAEAIDNSNESSRSSLDISDFDNVSPSPSCSNGILAFSIENLTRQ
jgi:uncharacterized Zn-finger protein